MASRTATRSWSRVKTSELRNIRGVCFDIDDTISSQGKLTAHAFHALWKLKTAGFTLVPITGRPAGWCDHIARFWPVDAVVGENGAFFMACHKGVLKKFPTPNQYTEKQQSIKLQKLARQIQHVFPKAKWASDQSYRNHDLAIDICEDVKPWRDSDVRKLLELCKKQGAHAKVSSIHVNAWFGDYDKNTGFSHWSQWAKKGNRKSIKPLPEPDQWIFIGDSPNDEPLFESFHFTVGVSNLKPYLASLRHPPRWITRYANGKGFSEVATRLTQRRTL